MRATVALASLFLLAGCADPAPEPIPETPPVMDIVGDPVVSTRSYVPLPPWQTLHLGDGTVSGAALTQTADQAMQLPANWTYVMQAPAHVDGGLAVFWVEVPEDMLVATIPGIDGRFCPWRMSLQLRQPGVLNLIGVRCPNQEEPTVPAGIYEVRFHLHLLMSYPKDVIPGDQWDFGLAHSLRPLSGSDAKPRLLTGSVSHDSRVQFEGFDEPFPAPAAVPCDGTYTRLRQQETSMILDHSAAGGSSGIGMALRLDDDPGLLLVDAAFVWTASPPNSEALRIRLEAAEQTVAEAEGPSPLVFQVESAALGNGTALSAYLVPGGDVGFVGRSMEIRVDVLQTFSCPPPLTPG